MDRDRQGVRRQAGLSLVADREAGDPIGQPAAGSLANAFADDALEREGVQDQAGGEQHAERQSEQPSSTLVFHDDALPIRLVVKGCQRFKRIRTIRCISNKR